MKIFSIVGARPQFIKVAALHRAIKKHKKLQHYILHTGQHYDYKLSGIFFKELEIPKPAYHLNLDEGISASSTECMQKEIEEILADEKPDLVTVLGDTNSTLAGALAAKNTKIKLAHIEAGLRSFNISMPEEFNRIQTDKLSDILFCPTTQSVNNLNQECLNINAKIILSGDIMLDAFNYYAGKLKAKKQTTEHLKNFILCTLHRESLVQSPKKIVEVIKALNDINKKFPILLPSHPRLKNFISTLGLQIDFTIMEPVGYLEMITLLKACSLVITDSGGLQKEAYFSEKMCLTLREETEWTELVKAGVNFIAGDSSAENIISCFEKAVAAKENFNEKFYGNGNAAEIIVDEIEKYLC
jgi:UDP-GlcNAc3NAcA epimerase